MVNEQKPPSSTPPASLGSCDVISTEDFIPRVGKALELITAEPDKTIFVGDDASPKVVLISMTEYLRLFRLDVERIERAEAQFQGELSDRAASGKSLPLDDPAELFTSIGFDAEAARRAWETQ